ncbi:bifunctional DNA primase/polymerase [Acrocarpospora catenulata]|uniref:bifunctional DNA primase/polymerase n=1 Tax=Acrocarpospora catenulata TaxID=2836182 RepID=UPI0035562787
MPGHSHRSRGGAALPSLRKEHPTVTTHPVLRYALAAARRGWPVFPLAPGDKEPLKGWPRDRRR